MFTGAPFKKDKTDKRKRPEREKKPMTKTKALVELHPAPEGLNDYAQREWDRLMRNVSNLIHPQDLGLLEMACRAWGVYCELESEMSENTNRRFDINLVSGTTSLSAKSIESGRQLKVYKDIVIQFGATPISRLKIAEPKKDDKAKDPMEELLNKIG